MKVKRSDYFILAFLGSLVVVAFMMLVVYTAKAETVQLDVKECTNYADSVGNIALWRKQGMTKDEVDETYNRNVPAYDKLDAESKGIYKVVHQQVKDVFAIAPGKFADLTPEMLVVDALRYCHKNARKLELGK